MFKTVRKPKPEMLGVLCYDARIGGSQDAFIEHEYRATKHNGRLKTVTLPGGMAFAVPGTKKFQIALAIISFTLKHFPTIKRIVIISHADCGWYKSIGEQGNERPDIVKAKAAVEKTVTLLKLGRTVTVTAFFAAFTGPKQKKATFEEV